jgi:hypothetical protein
MSKFEEGEIYCIKYISHESLTDKWHTLSIVYVTEVNGLHVKGINLLYLNPAITLKILSEAERVKKEKLKGSRFYNQLLKEFESHPLVCATKQFTTHRIMSSFVLKREDWGMVPLVEKGKFGNLNVIALQEDWKREEAQLPEKKKKKKKRTPKMYSEPIVELEEDDMFSSLTASVFGEKTETLNSLRDEIMEEDDI